MSHLEFAGPPQGVRQAVRDHDDPGVALIHSLHVHFDNFGVSSRGAVMTHAVKDAVGTVLPCPNHPVSLSIGDEEAAHMGLNTQPR